MLTRLCAMLLLAYSCCLSSSPAAAQVLYPTPAEVVLASANTSLSTPTPSARAFDDSAGVYLAITEDDLRERLLEDRPSPPSLPYDLGLVLQLREWLGQMTTYRGEVVTVRIDPLKPRCTFQFNFDRDGQGARR